MIQFNFDVDNDTQRLFEIIAYMLSQYFSYSSEQAIDLINQHYHENRRRHPDYEDDFYHMDGFFETALKIHYFEGLKNKNQNNYRDWKLENDYNRTPAEALEYFRKHYFTNP